MGSDPSIRSTHTLVLMPIEEEAEEDRHIEVSEDDDLYMQNGDIYNYQLVKLIQDT